MKPTIYVELGGEQAIRELVDRFYDHMETVPFAAEIRAMHPEDLTESRDKLFSFLSMWTGGPRTYFEENGHPRLRARHMPFPIDEAARDAWIGCMALALDEQVDNTELRDGLLRAFAGIANHMRNRA